MADHLHNGHRQRVKDRYAAGGIDVFSPHEIVEFLLFFAIPQKDTNELAHRLIETFGTVRGILNAEPETLMNVEGMTPNAVMLLRLMGDVRRYCNCEEEFKRVRLLDTDSQVDFFRPYFEDCTREVVWMATLDVSGHLLGMHKISEGTPLEADVNMRTVLFNALTDNAVNVVIAHNHPSGLALPSNADIRCTARIASILLSIGIGVLDHLVFARGDCVSFKQTRSIRHTLTGGVAEKLG
ncbi:MAG: hypothetical protein IKV35_07150 [Clostridia bacterium]|nr:hypothetical protein [Clostridia bacterium]